MKVIIFSPGGSPIPATKGGAVECLIDYIIKENEIEKKMDLSVVSMYDESAVEESKKYFDTKFYFIKFPFFIKLLDKLTFFIAKNILKKKKVLTYRLIFQRLWTVLCGRKILKKNSFDYVVLENHVSLLLLFKNNKLLKKYEGKIIYHEHNLINNDIGCSKIILGCKKIITVSDYISKEFHKKYPSYNLNNVIKLPNVADMQIFGTTNKSFIDNFKLKFGICDTDVIILFAGRLDATKGVKEVVEAYNLLINNGCFPNVKLLICGSYAYSLNISDGFDMTLKKMAESNKIIFTGYVDFINMPSLYKMAYLTVLPSIWDDPAPLSIIEALCSGCALITTDSGGIPEYAKDAAIILKRDKDLVHNILANMTMLLENQDLRNSLSNKALEKTKSWTRSVYYNNFINILNEKE